RLSCVFTKAFARKREWTNSGSQKLLGHLLAALARNNCANSFAADGPLDISFFVEIEHDNWHVVLHALSDRRRIHHSQILFPHLAIAKLPVQQCMGVFFRIVAINAIYSSRFEQYIGF